MDINLVFGIVILLILVSLQYTLNLILKELRDIRRRLIKTNNEIK